MLMLLDYFSLFDRSHTNIYSLLFQVVDYGGQHDFGDTDVPAKEALVIMFTGFEQQWKLTMAYFLIRGATGPVLAGLLREALQRAFSVGVKVRSITADGAPYNLAAFKMLGANLQPDDVKDMDTSFDHPSEGADCKVYIFPDYPHSLKSERNCLSDYKIFVWPGHGLIKWDYLVQLHKLQENHTFRLGNKLSSKHIFYKKQKMKVSLCVQAIASKSVANALRWAHESKIEGFEHNDVLVTAKFLELHDKMLDICNSRSQFALGLRRALSSNNIQDAYKVFDELTEMITELETEKGVKLIHSRRKTGFLGLLACAQTIRGLFQCMEDGSLELEHLRCYKMCQGKLLI